MIVNTASRECINKYYSGNYRSIHLPYIQELPSNINIFKDLENVNTHSVPLKLNEQVVSFLDSFKEILISYNNSRQLSNNLPPLAVNILEDGATLIEWIFPDFRIGFSLENKVSASSWYLITNNKFKESLRSELFDPSEPQELLSSIVAFALQNS